MDAMKRFLRTTFLGGLIVLLPIGVVAWILVWVWTSLTGMLAPLSQWLAGDADGRELSGQAVILSQVMALLIVIASCFFVGLIVRTAAGRYLHASIEKRVLRYAPGYNLIKETVLQLLGGRKSPFSQVAIVRPYDGEALMTGFVTDEHPSGWRTVFIPTGPNPTSGNIFHLPGERVFPLDVPVEEAMRSIISCGAGSEKVLDAHLGQETPPPAQS